MALDPIRSRRVISIAHTRSPALLLITAVCTSLGLLAGAPAAAAEQHLLRAALESITADELQRHVAVLADDSFEGREAGSRGGHAAGGYLAGYFQKYGLKPAGDRGSYYQSFGSGYRNLLGIIEGRDEQLKHEYILISAHYDHVGYGSQSNSYGPTGYIHNGADDNASGTAAMLELMDAFQKLPQPPRRSILFGLWDGEEQGLLGSEHFVSQPTIPLDRIKLMINVDMIGRMRNQQLEVYGTRSGQGLRQLVSLQNSGQLDLHFNWELKNNSDHYPFFERNIPILMFHTGLHDDYHRPSDDAHKINADGIQLASHLMLHVTNALAEQSESIRFRPASRNESPATQVALEQPQPHAPPRLGVLWNDEADASNGLELTQVVGGSAAERAGLQPGDRLVQLDGEPIRSADQFRAAIAAAEEDIKLQVQRSETPEPVTVAVTLAGSPTRIGLSWREDRAEPGSVVISRVVPGSLAAQAGLQVRDRIYSAQGKPFQSSSELAERLRSEPLPISVAVERRGRVFEAALGE